MGQFLSGAPQEVSHAEHVRVENQEFYPRDRSIFRLVGIRAMVKAVTTVYFDE